jgi:hypothetical protein
MRGLAFSVWSKHYAFIHILERFTRRLHDEELRVQSHSWYQQVRVTLPRGKVVTFQIQSANSSSATSSPIESGCAT